MYMHVSALAILLVYEQCYVYLTMVFAPSLVLVPILCKLYTSWWYHTGVHTHRRAHTHTVPTIMIASNGSIHNFLQNDDLYWNLLPNRRTPWKLLGIFFRMSHCIITSFSFSKHLLLNLLKCTPLSLQTIDIQLPRTVVCWQRSHGYRACRLWGRGAFGSRYR